MQEEDLERRDWLSAQCRYATICADINNILSSRTNPHSRKIACLESELQDWYNTVPGNRTSKRTTISADNPRQITTCVLFQLLEAQLHLLDAPQDEIPPEKIFSIAKEVFLESSKIDDGFYDR